MRFDGFGNIRTDLVGREAQLQEITKYFSAESSERLRIFSICGFPGEGKTRLALEYCIREHATYGDDKFWIDARSDMMALRSFEKIAAEMGVPCGPDLIQISESVKVVRERLKNSSKRWLMVFDSYDRPEDFPDLKRLIPTGNVTFL